MVSRRDLHWFIESGLTRPVDTLLDERGVDFGDAYSRDAIEAFSSDNRLQCMPYGVSPQVVFYNEALVDFARMELRGLDVPDADHRRWSWDQFVAPRRLRGAPRPRHQGRRDRARPCSAWRRSSTPAAATCSTTTATRPRWRSPATAPRARWRPTLQLLRDPKLTLSEEQLDEQYAARSGSRRARSA